jgi:hypothetical protein
LSESIVTISHQWVDINGRLFTGTVMGASETLIATSGVLTLTNAIKGCSNAAYEGAVLSQWVGPGTSGAPSSGPYATARDRATLLCVSSSGSIVHVTLAAPKGIFQADGVAVDLTNSNVVSLVAAILSAVRTTSGDRIIEVVRGWRSKIG